MSGLKKISVEIMFGLEKLPLIMSDKEKTV
jgi:hypothetical protein